MLPLSLLALILSFQPFSTFAVDASDLSDSMVSAAWYAGWHAEEFPLSDVSWEKYTHMKYAFAVSSNDGSHFSLQESERDLLSEFVETAHEHGVKASLSIGGWGGSLYFSSSVGSEQNRTDFLERVLDVVDEFGLDGIDFDWEYPNHPGVGCNVQSPNDTSNFLTFLQSLRSEAKSDLIITAATTLTPFIDSSGSPSSDVSAFAEIFDYIAIMNYDVWNFFSNETTAGPNSPLDDSCVPDGRGVGSATSALKAWTDAGFPADKIVLGVPAYGHSYTVQESSAFSDGGDELAAYPSHEGRPFPFGDSWDVDLSGAPDVCGAQQNGPTGVFNFWGMIDEGYLDDDGEVADGIDYRWDNCSQTPFVYNPDNNVMIAYDDVRSFDVKGNFIKSNGLKGFAIWEAAGDKDDILLDAILNATINGSSSNDTSSSDSGDGSRTTSSSASDDNDGEQDEDSTSSVSVPLLRLGMLVLLPVLQWW